MRSLLRSFGLALKNIRSNLFHTFLSILGVVIGVAALVTILSLIDGLQKMAHEKISSVTSVENVTVSMSPYETLDGVRVRKPDFKPLMPEDFKEMTRNLPVKEAVMMSRLTGIIDVDDTTRIGMRGYAVTEPKETPEFFAGESISTDAFEKAIPDAILSYQAASALRESPKDLIGDSINFHNRQMKIVGVLDSTEEENNSIVFPIGLLTKDDLNENTPMIQMKANTVEQVPEIKESLQTWLKEKYGDSSEEDFNIITSEKWVDQLNQGFAVFRVVMGMIIGISVLVGGIGIMNVLLISVNERVREIGIRKATGAKRKDIVWLFMAESITISSFGSLIGLVVGIGFSLLAVPIAKMIVDIPFEAAFTGNTMMVIAVVAILIGVLFGTYPAVKASKLDPVEAIRKE